ncbi:hypothetical protein ACRCD5_01135 [Campylobacter taeniopygiae]|uniref:hypothetical protein n=1 Tax=Campylobacter taeniopygiae TaxID=2510188 RepID=UPI003D6AF4CD
MFDFIIKEKIMAITLATIKGSLLYVYDGNKQLYSRPFNPKTDALIGFTSSTVSIKRDRVIYTYDEKGHQISYHPAT